MLNHPNKPPVTLESDRTTRNTLKLENTLDGTDRQTDIQAGLHATVFDSWGTEHVPSEPFSVPFETWYVHFELVPRTEFQFGEHTQGNTNGTGRTEKCSSRAQFHPSVKYLTGTYMGDMRNTFSENKDKMDHSPKKNSETFFTRFGA